MLRRTPGSSSRSGTLSVAKPSGPSIRLRSSVRARPASTSFALPSKAPMSAFGRLSSAAWILSVRLARTASCAARVNRRSAAALSRNPHATKMSSPCRSMTILRSPASISVISAIATHAETTAQVVARRPGSTSAQLHHTGLPEGETTWSVVRCGASSVSAARAAAAISLSAALEGTISASRHVARLCARERLGTSTAVRYA